VCALAACQLPYPFDGTQVRTVGWEELQRKTGAGTIPPVFVQVAMVVFGIVENNDDAAASVATGLAELLQEAEEGVGVEHGLLPLEHELAIPQSDGAKVSHALAGGVVQEHGILGFRRYPHPASGAVLLEVDFVGGPQINPRIPCQLPEFF